MFLCCWNVKKPKNYRCSYFLACLWACIHRTSPHCWHAAICSSVSGHYVPCRTVFLWRSFPACLVEATSTLHPSRWVQPAGSPLLLQTWPADRPATGTTDQLHNRLSVCMYSSSMAAVQRWKWKVSKEQVNTASTIHQPIFSVTWTWKILPVSVFVCDSEDQEIRNLFFPKNPNLH